MAELGTDQIDTHNPESRDWFSRSPFGEMGSGNQTKIGDLYSQTPPCFTLPPPGFTGLGNSI